MSILTPQSSKSNVEDAVIHSDEIDGDLLKLADTQRVTKLVLWILGFGFGGFLLWAAVVPLDEGVPTMGSVVIDTKRRPVQHLQGGTVKEVLVREGQLVKAGQVLLRLSDTTVRAEFENARQTLAGLQAQEKSRTAQLELILQELRGVRELVKQDYMPLVRQLELERQVSQLEVTIKEAQYQISATQERLKSTQETLQRAEIKSPDEGQVVGLAVQSPGAVIQPGQKLMDIVPEREDLVLEAKIFPHLIDRIAVGDVVDVRFSAFSHSPMLVVEGRLMVLSQDVLMDEATRTQYYLARVVVTPEGLRKLGNRKMQPGMPVEVVVKTGSRTLLKYIADPLIKRVAMSLKEE